MATSARLARTTTGTLSGGQQVVVLNEIGKSGLLRLLGALGNHNGSSGNGDFTIKVEIDGVTIYNGIYRLLISYGAGALTAGMPVNYASTVSSVMSLLNMPFNSSIKITLTNNTTYTYSMIDFLASYVIDVKN